MSDKNHLPQESHTEIRPSKLQNALQNIPNKPRLIFELIGIILLLSFAALLFNNVPREDYDALQKDYDSLQSAHETLQTDYNHLQIEYDKATLDLETVKITLNDTQSAYEAYQNRMMPFHSLTDEELNTVASKITQTLEAKQAEDAAAQAAAEAQAVAHAEAQAQAAQQQAQENTVWIPRTGSKYHSNSSCSNMKNPSQMTLSQAQASGYEPCKKCY
jgi:hypothetical protein